jgi:hypothetical protein
LWIVDAFQTVDRRDVVMAQRREDLGFSLEARQSIGIGRKRFRKDFDGDARLSVVSDAR